ncbi:MAG: alpha/beta hydrolase, partial [Chloroflexota bacterium]
ERAEANDAMSAITVGGDLVHYEVLGRGRPVVLVHGWIGSWRYWIPTMQHLHMRYRVYALDLFGYGDSGKNPRKYTIQQQVDMLDEFMDQLAIPKAAFIGHGLGAMILSEFAFKHQDDRVPRLMLISNPLFDIGNLEARRPMRLSKRNDDDRADPDSTMMSSSLEATIPSAGMMRQALLERAAVRNRSRGRATSGEASSETSSNSSGNLLAQSIATTSISSMLDRCFDRKEIEFDKLNADVSNTDERVLMKSIAEFDAGKMLDTVNQLQIPTMMIHGQQDPLIPNPTDAVWNYVTDNSEQKVALSVEGVRHFPMLENERFGRFVLDFLEARDITALEGIKGRWQRRSR